MYDARAVLPNCRHGRLVFHIFHNSDQMQLIIYSRNYIAMHRICKTFPTFTEIDSLSEIIILSEYLHFKV